VNRDVVLGRPRETLLAAEHAGKVTELAAVSPRWNFEREVVLASLEAALGLREIKRASAGFERLNLHRALGAHDMESPVRTAEGITVIAAKRHDRLRVLENRHLIVGQSDGRKTRRLAERVHCRGHPEQKDDRVNQVTTQFEHPEAGDAGQLRVEPGIGQKESTNVRR
jgi:hypothetical protein